jgi:hypothetical protein
LADLRNSDSGVGSEASHPRIAIPDLIDQILGPVVPEVGQGDRRASVSTVQRLDSAAFPENWHVGRRRQLEPDAPWNYVVAEDDPRSRPWACNESIDIEAPFRARMAVKR